MRGRKMRGKQKRKETKKLSIILRENEFNMTHPRVVEELRYLSEFFREKFDRRKGSIPYIK
jgi:hypothetical protein